MAASRTSAVLTFPRRLALAAALLAAALPGAGCVVAQRPAPAAEARQEAQTNPNQRYRSRPPINTNRNLYEGGLWQGAASWGNLMRDHRARYQGDLLTVTNMAEIIKVPEPKPEPAPEAAAQTAEEQRPLEDPIVAFLREQEKRREAIDREQNEILRSVQTVEVEVVKVLANGNLVVRGAHPPVYRDQGRVKYVITLRGIVRPSDVDDNNTIQSAKLSKAEYQIRRFVKRSAIPSTASSAARAAGATRQAGILDRFSNFLTAK